MKRTREEQARWLSELPSHRLAFEDVDFLKIEELRPVRLQLELLKPAPRRRKRSRKTARPTAAKTVTTRRRGVLPASCRSTARRAVFASS